MEESVVEKINIRQMLKGFIVDLFKTELEASEEEMELPEELRVVTNRIDEDANNLIDRKYIPKKSRDLLKKNSLKNGLSVKDLKEATQSSSKIQSADFIKKNHDEIEENISSKEIGD